jgi:DNA-binding HxlR family transcriptional regulator
LWFGVGYDILLLVGILYIPLSNLASTYWFDIKYIFINHMENEQKNCDSVQITVKVVGGKWKPPILYLLGTGVMRFGQLKKAIGGITQKMLAQELKEMERDGLVNRKVYPVIPPKVEYSLTVYGKSLEPILKGMSEWGKKHKNRF